MAIGSWGFFELSLVEVGVLSSYCFASYSEYERVRYLVVVNLPLVRVATTVATRSS
jgi:hypothetical protein